MGERLQQASTPDRRIPGRIRRNLARIGLAGVIAGAGTGVAACDLIPDFLQGKATPTPSGSIGEKSPTPIPTPFSTESPTITLPPSSPSPSPEVSPSPTPSTSPEATPKPTPDMTKWWNQIPESKYSNMNDVKLNQLTVDAGSLFSLITIPGHNPNYLYSLNHATIFKVKPDKENDIIWVWVGLKGNKSTITSSGIYIDDVTGKRENLDTWQGLTIKLGISDKNPLFQYKLDPGALANRMGTGLSNIAPHLAVGDALSFDIAFESFPIAPLTKTQINTNKDFLRDLYRTKGEQNKRDTVLVAYASDVCLPYSK